tara:strand:- start:916 stop:1740 length:825 start_codon:yes stop_codon:yes gene_type:complete
MEIIADVGGTRGRWVIVDKTKIKTIETSGFNPYSYNISSLDKILESLKKSIRSFKIERISYYGAGINNLQTKSIVEKSIKNHFLNTEVDVFSDLLGSCRALCKDKKGVVSILGTGSNSCYFDGNQIKNKINSLGYLLGDEGSGYVLGKSFLKKHLRNEFPNNLSISFNDNFNIKENFLRDIYKGDSYNMISKISKFIYTVKKEKIINKLLIDHFTYYFKEIILKYNTKNIYLSGSVAHYFSDEIKEVSRGYNFNIMKIIKDPIDHLIKYHVEYK